MRCQCIICTDHFDAAAQIASVPCGHTFHQSCLERWLKNNPTCPTCRIRVKPKDVRKVFLQSLDDTILDSGDLENELSDARLRIHELRQEIIKYEEDQQCLKNIVKKSETALEICKQKYYNAVKDATSLKAKQKYLNVSLAENEMLKKSINDLQATVTQTNHLRTVLNGTTSEVEEILKTYGNLETSTRSIATYCVLLKREVSKKSRELRISQDEHNEAQRKITKLNQDLAGRNQQLEKAHAEIAKYKEKCEQLTKHLDNLPEAREHGVKRISSECRTSIPGSIELDVTVVPSPPVLKVRSAFLAKSDNEPFAKPLPGYTKMRIVQKQTYETSKKPTDEDNLLLNMMKRRQLSNDSDDRDSKIRSGYNGLGGHSNYIQKFR